MTTTALQSGNRLEVTARVRDEIISSLATSILKFTIRPTPEQYTYICTKPVETYPILEDMCGIGTVKIVSVYLLLEQSLC